MPTTFHKIQRIYISYSAMGGGGNGNPLQYSCLENPRDRGAWWAAVYGVAQSWTRLKRLGIVQWDQIEVAEKKVNPGNSVDTP